SAPLPCALEFAKNRRSISLPGNNRLAPARWRGPRCVLEDRWQRQRQSRRLRLDPAHHEHGPSVLFPVPSLALVLETDVDGQLGKGNRLVRLAASLEQYVKARLPSQGGQAPAFEVGEPC